MGCTELAVLALLVAILFPGLVYRLVLRARRRRGKALRRPAAILLGLLAAYAAGTAHAAVEGYHYTREVAVTEAGWVRVPLDLAAIQHLAPGGADLHVLSPSGGEAPVRIETTAARTERRPVKSFKVERSEGAGAGGSGGSLLLDLGANPIPHERLFLRTARPSLAPPDQIESSPDGAAWKPLTPGEPFRAEAGENWISISYPVTGDRWLRLHWPREAGVQQIEAAEVESVTGPTLAIATRNPDCDPGPPGAIFCNLPLPAAGQVVRRLTMEVQEKGIVGYRLDAPREGRWQSVVEGVWQPAQPGGGRTRHVLAGGAEALAGSQLRLELYGAPGSAPRLTSYGIELTVQTVVFEAGEAGQYTLAYGGPPRREGMVPPPPGEEATWLEAGSETEHPLPPLPATAAAPSVRLGSGRLKASWRVVAPAARPGSLVRLELPDSIYAAARADLGNLRLVTGDRQIPFYHWSLAAPALALWQGSVRPTGDVRAKESTLEVRLARSGLPLTELDVMAAAQPLRRNKTLSYQEPAAHLARRRGDEPKAASPTLRATWECMPQAPLPCRLRLPLPGRAPSVLSLKFHDGDNPPLPDLDTAVWRRRDILLFVWPQAVPKGASVRLLAGADSLTAPSYDLQALGDALTSRPWQPAEISAGAPAGGQPWWSRWLRPLMLGLAGLWLILLLRRILMES
jgi:hypothetical protein